MAVTFGFKSIFGDYTEIKLVFEGTLIHKPLSTYKPKYSLCLHVDNIITTAEDGVRSYLQDIIFHFASACSHLRC